MFSGKIPQAYRWKAAKESADRLKVEAAKTLDPVRRQRLLSLANYNSREASRLGQPH